MALKEEKVFVTSGKKKASVRKETNAVSGMRVTIVRKNQNPKPPHLSEPTASRGRSVSKNRSIHGKSNHAVILRQLCRCNLKGTCTRARCEYWHPPKCQFNETETGCKAGDKCLFPHHKVDEQTNKKPKKGDYFHKRKENQDKNAVAVVKIVPQLGCVSQDSEALVSQRGTQYWGNPMQQVLGPIRRIRFTQSTLRQASIREKKGPSLGKIQIKNPHQRGPHALKFEDRSHEETERQQRCARSKASNLAKKHFQAQRKRQCYILLARGRMGTPGCVNKRAGGKKVCSGFRSWCAHGQQESH